MIRCHPSVAAACHPPAQRQCGNAAEGAPLEFLRPIRLHRVTEHPRPASAGTSAPPRRYNGAESQMEERRVGDGQA